ncbi:MAG: glycosyltransferase [Actinobacteria bacterium 13_2_20CM_2_72_6]|nr:MAG: glycosyltransferase [Actinobacteria bacterium 13_2_20CM_2_72_6]
MSQRVALVLASSTGGIGQHVASLARGLSRRGFEVTVIGPGATGDRFDFTGATFHALPVSAGPRVVPGLSRALAGLRPDVVHAHGLRAGLVAGMARPAGVPFVVTWHNAVLASGLRGAVHRLLERRVARLADVTLGASADLVARALAVGGRDVRPCPVSAPDLAPPTPPPLVAVAGSGPVYLKLAALASSARAPVVLLGHREDVSDLLGAADVAVVTSRWEARQLFAQEALRAGVPLVATSVGGLPELVGDAAVLVPPGDVDAVATAVAELLDAPQRREELATRGRERAATWPTEEQTVDRVQALYAELTGLPAER